MKDILQASSDRRMAYEHVALSLAMRYDTIYYVNVEDGAYTVFSSTEDYRELELSDEQGDFFDRMGAHISDLIHPGDWKGVAILFDRKAMSDVLSTSYVRSETFRIRYRGNFVYMNMQIMPAEDALHWIVGFKNVDVIERRRREAAAQARIYSNIARTLARRYDWIYYLDLEANSCMRFSSRDVSVDAGSLMDGDTFFENMRRMSVHRDDQPMMEPLTNREALVNAVEHRGGLVTTVRIRREHQCVYTRFRCVWADDHRHIIVAEYDVDDKVRDIKAQQKSLRIAERRAMTDDLTHVRNKNAYADFEEELQRCIDEGTVEPLAIAVCDVNNLKSVNDDHGHKAGDALIQAACKLICVVYAHSPVFRVGGDEFAVVMQGEDYRNRRELLDKMRATALDNLQNGGAVVAVGMADYDGDEYITDVFERADREMYENKRALKDRSNKQKMGNC